MSSPKGPREGRAYSQDMRFRALQLHEEEGKNAEEIAEILNTCSATIKRWMRQYQTYQHLRPGYAGGRKSPITGEIETTLIEIVQTKSDLSLQEYCDCLFQATDLRVSTSAMSRALLRLSFTQKKSPHTMQKVKNPRSRNNEKNSKKK